MIMKSSIKFNILTAICPLALGTLVLFGCSKGSNNNYETYGAVDSLVATFTVTPVPGNDTKFVITNTTQGACVGTRWDVGKSTSTAAMGKTTDTVFYPQAGTYAIKMWALDKRGKLYSAKPVSVTTTKNDPAFDNLIKGGKMNAGDDQYWNVFNANTNYKATWTIVNNYYKATTPPTPLTAQVNGGIYQAVQVVANKTYQFKMDVSYGAPQDAWLELYIGTTSPADGKDYTEGGKKLGPIVWGNWTAFTGSITPYNISFGASGTIYIVIKTGANSPNGSFSNQGLNVTNVDFRRTQE
jgi:hypothetical protein